MKKVVIAAGLACLVNAGSGQAATVNVAYTDTGPFGFPNHSQLVKISSAHFSGNARAGAYRLRGDNGFGDFLAFCVDLTKAVRDGQAYETAAALFAGATLENINRLFSSAYAGVDTAVEAAGFQVALWEIIEDTATGFDLSSGAFSMSGNDGAASVAQGYLGGLAQAVPGAYDLTFLASDTSQNLVTARLAPQAPPALNPVPLPAAGWLLAAGLGGLAALRRKLKG